MLQRINNKQKTRKTNPSVRRAFTLLEVMVALFIFSIAMVAVTGIFVSFFKTNLATKKTQKALEDSNQTMNIMAKMIRTSSVALTSGTPVTTLRILEYSGTGDPQCLAYRFSGNRIQYTGSVSIPSGLLDDCTNSASATLATFNNIIDTPLTGSFFVTSSSAGVVGKVTILINVTGIAGTTASYPIQSTVSLRDYVESNP